MEQVAVIGAGSWGSALAVHLALVGHDVKLWGRDGSLVDEMAARRANPVYLPDVTFPPGLSPTAELRDALATASIVVVTVPSHGVRAVARQVAPLLVPGALVVSAMKGIEEGTLLRMSEVLASELPSAGDVVVLSGPSFALELARRLPTAVVVASLFAAYGRTRAGAVPIPVAAPLRHGGRDGRGARRRAEEHHRDCGGRGRRPGPRPQRARGADHARTGGGVAAGGCASAAQRDTLCGPRRARRSGADLHRRPEPQPSRRRRAGARPLTG